LAELLANRGVEDPATFAADRYVLFVQNGYTWLGVFTFVLPFALMLRWLCKAYLNLAEALVVATYVIAHVMLVSALLQLVTVTLLENPGIHGTAGALLYLVFTATAARGIGPGGWGTTFRALVSMACAFLVFLITIAIGTQLLALLTI